MSASTIDIFIVCVYALRMQIASFVISDCGGQVDTPSVQVMLPPEKKKYPAILVADILPRMYEPNSSLQKCKAIKGDSAVSSARARAVANVVSDL